MLITPLLANDYTEWLPLWLANMEHQVENQVTATTWARICDPDSMVGGLGARLHAKGPLVAICHYILHPTTGNIKLVCYMQDLYVDVDARRQGVAQALVQELAAMGKREHWARLYWLAESKNEAAQQLYQSLGLKLDFTLHVLPV